MRTAAHVPQADAALPLQSTGGVAARALATQHSSLASSRSQWSVSAGLGFASGTVGEQGKIISPTPTTLYRQHDQSVREQEGRVTSMERWRAILGHDGYLLVDLRLSTGNEGGRNRALQSGYRAQWWLHGDNIDRWLGSGPIDLPQGQRSLKPGQRGRVQVFPMLPAHWVDVEQGAVVYMRERVGQTLATGVVVDRVGVPADADLALSGVTPSPPSRDSSVASLSSKGNRWSWFRVLRRTDRLAQERNFR